MIYNIETNKSYYACNALRQRNVISVVCYVKINNIITLTIHYCTLLILIDLLLNFEILKRVFDRYFFFFFVN